MIRAKRGAHRRDRDLRLAIAPDERDDFFAQIGIELRLDVAAMKGMRGLVVKALPVDGIDAIKFDAAGIDEIRERADQSLAFEFPFIAGAGRKTNDGRAPMAVHDDAEFPSEAVRIPAVIVALHEGAFRIPNSRSGVRESMPAEAGPGQRESRSCTTRFLRIRV